MVESWSLEEQVMQSLREKLGEEYDPEQLAELVQEQIAAIPTRWEQPDDSEQEVQARLQQAQWEQSEQQQQKEPEIDYASIELTPEQELEVQARMQQAYLKQRLEKLKMEKGEIPFPAVTSTAPEGLYQPIEPEAQPIGYLSMDGMKQTGQVFADNPEFLVLIPLLLFAFYFMWTAVKKFFKHVGGKEKVEDQEN